MILHPAIDVERDRPDVVDQVLFGIDGGIEEAVRLIVLDDVLRRLVDHILAVRLILAERNQSADVAA